MTDAELDRLAYGIFATLEGASVPTLRAFNEPFWRSVGDALAAVAEEMLAT